MVLYGLYRDEYQVQADNNIMCELLMIRRKMTRFATAHSSVCPWYLRNEYEAEPSYGFTPVRHENRIIVAFNETYLVFARI